MPTERDAASLYSFGIRLLRHLSDGGVYVQYWMNAECANSDKAAILLSYSVAAVSHFVRSFIKFLHLSSYLVISCLNPTIDLKQFFAKLQGD